MATNLDELATKDQLLETASLLSYVARRDVPERRLEPILQDLRPRQREILKLRFGFGYEDTHTLEETGLIFKVTRQRIEQLQKEALSIIYFCRIGRLRRLAGASWTEGASGYITTKLPAAAVMS